MYHAVSNLRVISRHAATILVIISTWSHLAHRGRNDLKNTVITRRRQQSHSLVNTAHLLHRVILLLAHYIFISFQTMERGGTKFRELHKIL